VNREDAEVAKSFSRARRARPEKGSSCSLRVLRLFAVISLWSGAAYGDPYGEPPVKRDGFAFGAGLGFGLSRGAGGMEEIQGVGGDLNLRVGTVAAPELLWMVELAIASYLVEVDDADPGVDQTVNALSTLTMGAQIYLRPTLWLRGGAGFAAFAEREGRSGPEVEDARRAGVGFIGGGGYDFFRRGSFRLSIELASTVGAFKSGPVGHAGVLLGLAWY
jgi:hypothetical protein